MDHVLRERDVRKLTGLSRSTRWRLERRGDFPSRRRLSPGCVGWLRSEILDWLQSRATGGPTTAESPGA